jgi:DNA-binding transcriptional ArsR family regulator
MSLPRTVADVLRDHVTLQIEGIDRMYLNAYVPILQMPAGVAWFFRQHGHSFPSSALMAPMTERFVQRIESFVADNGFRLVTFKKGERKDDVTQDVLAHFSKPEGVLYVGRAQEKAPVVRTERRRNPNTGQSYAWLVKSTAMVNHYYFYCVDDDFGPFFLKFCSYFPYNAKLCINGHEYLKRQLAKERIKFEALDNGILTCADPTRAQQICDELSADRIDTLLRKWLARLPHPFTPSDRKAGARYDLSILQAEFSLTQVLDRPLSGRILFEQIIRENIDIGRPSQVQLIFDRRVLRQTPGRFRTRVITEGVVPSLHLDYKHTRTKQYHKEGHALRTETTINDTRDFGIGRRIKNLPALRQVGFAANRRLLDVQCVSQDCAIGEEQYQRLHRPVRDGTQRGASLRVHDPRVQALFLALILFVHLPAGSEFTCAEMRRLLGALRGMPLGSLTQATLSYDLRRLKMHGLIIRVPGTRRYRITARGIRTALFCTKLASRVWRGGFAQLAAPDRNTALGRAFAAVEEALDGCYRNAMIAA